MESVPYMKVYEDRVVAFIDILGFSEAVNNNSQALKILKALQKIKTDVDSHPMSDEVKSFKGVFDTEISSFSDSVVISGAGDQASIVYRDALRFASTMIKNGFLCRGAISFGELFHKDGLLFGQAFIDAYKAEVNRAIYPRIIVESDVVKLILESVNDPEEFARMLKTDFDGEQFIDLTYINDQPEKIEELLTKILNQTLKSDKSKSIRQKHYWVNNTYSLGCKLP